MFSSSRKPSGTTPIYTHDILIHAESVLDMDGEYLDIPNEYEKSIRIRNDGKGLSCTDVPPGMTQPRNVLGFQDERTLHRLIARGKGFKELFPVYPLSAPFHGPNKTVEEVRETMRQVIADFEASEEAAALANMVKTNLKGCSVDKVIGFGMGLIGYARPSLSSLHPFYEYAAARVLAKAAQEVSSAPSVAVLVQDPFYTNVCKQVLEEFDIEVIDCFGAKGFALMDRNSIVVAHFPTFPFRELVADLARPALISMRAQEKVSPPAAGQRLNPMPLLDSRADVDSERSRRMMKEYHNAPLPVTRQRAFYANSWYVRNDIGTSQSEAKSLSTVSPASDPEVSRAPAQPSPSPLHLQSRTGKSQDEKR
ncbi:hypothetical protein GGR51DRAFT_574099 [Nemania sp. FL0031]|nr:hypothetical protein GGR51DRAFT_574099 [Nemania sp. FL0031]